MPLSLLTIITIIIYNLAAVWQGWQLTNRLRPHLGTSYVGGLAVVLHGYLLYRWIDTAAGQDLSWTNMASLVIWLMSLQILMAAVRKPVKSLFVVIFPLASLSILLVSQFSSDYIINTGANPKQLWHILLSTLAFSVLCLAAIQAILLALQDWQLHHHHPNGVIRFFPSLEIMESLLFQTISLGFILLTLVLATSFLFFHPLTNAFVQQKTLVSVTAWLIFLFLLLGRHFLGWRGQTATRWTLSGVSLLILIYFGSTFLQQ